MSDELDVVAIGNIVSDFLAAGVQDKFKWGDHIVVKDPISLSLAEVPEPKTLKSPFNNNFLYLNP